MAYMLRTMPGIQALSLMALTTTIQSTSNLNNLTEGTTFQWSFPTVTDLYSPVRAYPDIIFGVAPYGDTVNATDTTHPFPMQLGNIAALTADYSTTYSGDTTGFNVSFDIWLTSAPNGDGSTVTNEIMIWTSWQCLPTLGRCHRQILQRGVFGNILPYGHLYGAHFGQRCACGYD